MKNTCLCPVGASVNEWLRVLGYNSRHLDLNPHLALSLSTSQKYCEDRVGRRRWMDSVFSSLDKKPGHKCSEQTNKKIRIFV